MPRARGGGAPASGSSAWITIILVYYTDTTINTCNYIIAGGAGGGWRQARQVQPFGRYYALMYSMICYTLQYYYSSVHGGRGRRAGESFAGGLSAWPASQSGGRAAGWKPANES